VAGTLLLTVLVVGLELLRPWPVKVVFDRVLVPRGTGPGVAGLSPAATLAAAAGAVLGISLLLSTVSVRATVLSAQVARKVTVRMRRMVFEHLHRLDFPFHQSSRTGDLLVRLMGDVNAVRDALYASWVNLAGRGMLFAGTAAVMVMLEPWLALLALYPLPLLALQVGASSRRLREVARDQRRREGDAASYAAETLRQIRMVKAYAAEDRAVHGFARQSRAGERAGVRAARISAHIERMTEVLTGVGVAMVLFVGAHWVLAGRISAGSLLVFMSYARSLYKPLRKASSEGTRLSKASACAGRLLEVLRIPPEDRGGGRPAPEFRGEVSLRGVRYRYPDGVEALRAVTLSIRAGELAVVGGPNGSGKSTLLSVLLRLVVPREGTVEVDGEPVESFDLDSYRRRFAYVPQDVHLFGATIRENILYGRPEATDREVEEAARAALLDRVVRRIPGGYDAVLGEAGATLSGGEARRLMLARAALRDARILLLDEPLAGLDPAARAVVAGAIRRIAAGRTAIVVSHGPSGELQPDVVFTLWQGSVAMVRRFHPAAKPGPPALPVGPLAASVGGGAP
jgi:ABC-type multidrug transport system fused ATPase/permease subunit